ncbi:MAG TPA: ATP-binding protein [Candidatus Sulfotelmatobacter sp.]|jgi:PAS domain S-box-containing protein
MNDLVSLLALPAIWSGGNPSQVLHTLLDAMVRMLRLELASVRLIDPVSEAPVELVRTAEWRESMPSAHEIFEALSLSLEGDGHKWPQALRKILGDREVSIVPVPLGLNAELGMIVVAAERADFPRQTEALLLNIAANQAVIGLQEARLRSRQKRVADELDRKVRQRTAELVAANAELQLQVAQLQQIPVAAWTILPDGTPDFVNQNWLEYTGQSLDYVQSGPETWMSVVHPEDRERASRSYWEGIGSGRGFTAEVRFRRARDGAYRWHLNRAVALCDADGKLLKFVGTSTDIEDLKQSQEELRITQANLAHVNRVTTMGELTASIAHEVNQPLSGIITNAGTCLRMLASDPPNVEGARETARRTIRDGNRASEVITRLRALFSKKSAATQPIDLNEAAREVIALSFSEFQSGRVVVRQELGDDLPLVNGDRVQLQQVILNLLRNGSDAMSTVDDRARELLIRTELDGDDRVRLSVTDVGVGFESQAAGRLFEPFYTTKNEGMGVGLSVSRSIIERHRGRLWAMPNQGPGVTFSFSIPCKPGDLTGDHNGIGRTPSMTDAG